jgi:hypothetical protein
LIGGNQLAVFRRSRRDPAVSVGKIRLHAEFSAGATSSTSDAALTSSFSARAAKRSDFDLARGLLSCAEDEASRDATALFE